MRAAGLGASRRRVGGVTTKQDKKARPPPDLVSSCAVTYHDHQVAGVPPRPRRLPGPAGPAAAPDRTARLVTVLASGLADSPPHTDTQRWEQALGGLNSSLDQLKVSRCKAHGSEVEAADALSHVHDGFIQLVLTLPPRDR